MALSFLLAPIPKWYLTDLFGRPASGGQLYTRSNINPTLDKPVYMDPNGDSAWSNPIIFDGTGSQGPFYWQVDPNNLDDTYYLEFYDQDDNLIWTVRNYFPPGEGGGGGGTTVNDVDNILVNNVFWRNNYTSALTVPQGDTVLAPSGHAAMYYPNIFFRKSNSTNPPTIEFKPFPDGTTPLTGDNTPVYFADYNAGADSGASTNGMFIPITSNLKTLENQQVTATIWAKSLSGSNEIELLWYQFAGTGGSPVDFTSTLSGIIPLTTNWARYTFTVTAPPVSNVTLGANSNSQLLLYIRLPTNGTHIQFTKPGLYQGSSYPAIDYQSNDEIDSLINTPRTGDIRMSINSFAPFGWVAANDGTIGNASSSATRANADTFYLYKLIWDSCVAGLAPLYAAGTPPGATVARGASADADFAANRQLRLTRALGRALAGTSAGTNGARTSQNFTSASIVLASGTITVTSTVGFQTGAPVQVSTTGTLPTQAAGTYEPQPLNAAYTYYAIVVSATQLRLSLSAELAIAGTAIVYNSGGTGTHTVTTPAYRVGDYYGEELHALTSAEMPPHTHTFLGPLTLASGVAGGSAFNQTTGTTSSTGGTNGVVSAHNTVQPTSYFNVFIKL